jgi:lipopolysaccharide export system permease protein
MKVLTRYLLRSQIGPFLFAFCALTGVIVINTIARQAATLAGKGLDLGIIFHFFVLSLPSTIALTLPMAVLVAVLFTFSQMAAENEISALKATGIDLRRMVIPLLLVAAGIAGAMAWFNDQVLPESNFQWKVLMIDIGQKSPLLALHEQTVNPITTTDGITRYYLQAQEIEQSSNKMWDVVIYDISEGRLGRTIVADSGSMAFNPSMTDLFLTLHDGYLHEVNFDEPENFQRIEFREQLLKMGGVGNELQRQTDFSYRGDREMTTAMLQERVDSLGRELAAVQATAKEYAEYDVKQALGLEVPRGAAPSAGIFNPRWEIPDGAGNSRRLQDQFRSLQERERIIQRHSREFRVEIHKKFAIAAATLVFVLIGVPLALRFPRGGIGMVIGFSLLIFAIYYVGLIGGETLADEGYVPPVVAMWTTNVVMGTLGIIGVLRMGRETGTQRGGGFGEKLEVLRNRFRRRPATEEVPAT